MIIKKYTCFIFLWLLIPNHAYSLTIEDGNVLKNILQCSPSTLTLGKRSVCSKWVVDAPDRKDIEIKDLKPRCASYTTLNSGSADGYVDNVDLSMKYKEISGYTTSYKCIDGTIKTTNSCSVQVVEAKPKPKSAPAMTHCHYDRKGKSYTVTTPQIGNRCFWLDNWHEVCPDKYGKGAYHLCANFGQSVSNVYAVNFIKDIILLFPCGLFALDPNSKAWKCMVPRTDTSSTKIQGDPIYAHKVNVCSSPTVKNVPIARLYDVNWIVKQ